MTFSYDPTLADNVSKVRFIIQDAVSATHQLEDGEITATLTDEGNVPIRAAINCCLVLAARYNSPKIQLGNKIAADYTSLRDFYLDLASRLGKKMARTAVAPFAGGITEADKESTYEDDSLVPAAFTRDMMTEPGTQTTRGQNTRTPGDWW